MDAVLSGRVAEIYEILRAESDLLGTNGSLPSLRSIQHRFSVGQVAAMQIQHALTSHYGLKTIPRKKIRKKPSQTSKMRETILLMCEKEHHVWQELVAHYNENVDSPIRIKFAGEIQECARLTQCEDYDFVLFPSNPFCLGLLKNSLSFIDLDMLFNQSDRSGYHDAAFLRDPGGRTWGIGSYLNTMVLSYNPKFCHLAMRNWNWIDIRKEFGRIKKHCPFLEYPVVLDGYISFLIDNGVRMVNPLTKEIAFDYDRFAPAAEYLRGMVQERLMPLFSDIYARKDGRYQMYADGKVAICQSFHGRILPHIADPVIPSPGEPSERHCLQSAIFCISACSMNYENARKFISYVLSEEAQRILVSNIPSIPAIRNLIPPHLDTGSFALFEKMVEHAGIIPEDYFFPLKARLRLACGIDRWIKFGGSLRSMLSDLEKTCRAGLDLPRF